MPAIPSILIDCPRCGNTNRVVDWDGRKTVKCTVCLMVLLPPGQAEPDRPPPAPGTSRADAQRDPSGADTGLLPDLDESEIDLSASTIPGSDTDPPASILPAPKEQEDAPRFPEYIRQRATKPLVFTPMVPGSFDPKPTSITQHGGAPMPSVLHQRPLTGAPKPAAAIPRGDAPLPPLPEPSGDWTPDDVPTDEPAAVPPPRAPRLMAAALVVVLATVAWLSFQALRSAGRTNDAVAAAPAPTTGESPSERKIAAYKLAEKFAHAATADARLAMVRDPDRVRDDLIRFHAGHPPLPIRTFKEFGIESGDDREIFYHLAIDAAGRSRLVCVVPTAAGSKVDWECYARHGTATGEQLLAPTPITATVRVLATLSRYYNYDYSNEADWIAVEISNADWPEPLTAYCARDSKPAAAVSAALAGKSSPQRLLVTIRTDEHTATRKQCLLEELVAATWIYPAP